MLTSKTTIPKETKDLQLSIQFSLDGFSFCIKSISSQNTLSFTKYSFENGLQNPEIILKEITSIFETDINLQQDFEKVLVIHQSNLSTVVPNEYFKESNLNDYLNFTIKTLVTDFVSFDDVNVIEAKVVFVPYVNINNYLFQNFGEFEYRHHTSELIEKLIKNNSTEEKQVFINVSKTLFDIVVLENKKLVLHNTFSYNTKEDFIYYVLFVAEQLTLDTEQINFFLIGDINKDSDLYQIMYTYIRNIYFLESKNNIFNNLEAERHSNFILLG
jgi:hypothetical protein